MRLQAPAKINLHLRVAPPVDGFHPLLSWMCTVGLFDTLEFFTSPAKLGVTPRIGKPNVGKPNVGKPLISLTCDNRNLESATNLVVRAAELLAAGLGDGKVSEPPLQLIDHASSELSLSDVAISLIKRIPMGGGLGGGSSDAATTLIALNRLWSAGLSTEQLAAIGAKLGSDIAFFFHGPSSVCTGRGEIVRAINTPTAKAAVLVFPDLAMPTPAVYQQFDAMNLGNHALIDDKIDWAIWTQLTAEQLLPHLVNDLEPAAFAISPALGDLRTEIEQKLGRNVRMSGSGSTLFTLFDSLEGAETTASEISRQTGTRAIAAELAPTLESQID